MLAARVSDLRRIIDQAEDDEDMPIYFLPSDGGSPILLPREKLLNGVISVVGPVPELQMPKHLIIKCPNVRLPNYT